MPFWEIILSFLCFFICPAVLKRKWKCGIMFLEHLVLALWNQLSHVYKHFRLNMVPFPDLWCTFMTCLDFDSWVVKAWFSKLFSHFLRINIWTYFILGEADKQKAKGKKKQWWRPWVDHASSRFSRSSYDFIDSNPYILDQNSGVPMTCVFHAWFDPCDLIGGQSVGKWWCEWVPGPRRWNLPEKPSGVTMLAEKGPAYGWHTPEHHLWAQKGKMNCYHFIGFWGLEFCWWVFILWLKTLIKNEFWLLLGE